MSIVAMPAMLGVHAAAAATVPAGTLIAGGVLHSPMTLTRSQPSGARSTAFGLDNATILAVAPDIPRFSGSARRLLIEGPRNNDIPQPTNFGSGSGWTTLTGGTGTVAVLTANYPTIAAPDGSFTATRLQLNRGAGTTSTDQSGISRSTVTTAARFIWARTVSGTANVQIGTNTTTAGNQSSVDTTWRRLGFGGTGGVHRVNLNGAAGNSAAADLLIWGASVEANAVFPTSLILPAVGASAVSSRGAEIVTAPLAGLGVPASGACTILWSGRVQTIGNGTLQTILQLDDATNTIRWLVDNPASGGNIRIGGSGGSTVAMGVATAGTPFRFGIAINGAGRAAGSFNGAAAVAATGGPAAGLTTLRLGLSASGANPTFGDVLYLRVLNTVLSDADLATQVAALPV
jgi:hypothetical protein